MAVSMPSTQTLTIITGVGGWIGVWHAISLYFKEGPLTTTRVLEMAMMPLFWGVAGVLIYVSCINIINLSSGVFSAMCYPVTIPISIILLSLAIAITRVYIYINETFKSPAERVAAELAADEADTAEEVNTVEGAAAAAHAEEVGTEHDIPKNIDDTEDDEDDADEDDADEDDADEDDADKDDADKDDADKDDAEDDAEDDADEDDADEDDADEDDAEDDADEDDADKDDAEDDENTMKIPILNKALPNSDDIDEAPVGDVMPTTIVDPEAELQRLNAELDDYTAERRTRTREPVTMAGAISVSPMTY